MLSRTHLAIDPQLVGRPLELSPGRATCQLDTAHSMVADDRGLIHGGFIFGLADYAAMLAVNDPNVVLGAANGTFTAPVVHPARLNATATVVSVAGSKHEVDVAVAVDAATVFKGTLTCFVLDHHVLDGKEPI